MVAATRPGGEGEGHTASQDERVALTKAVEEERKLQRRKKVLINQRRWLRGEEGEEKRKQVDESQTSSPPTHAPTHGVVSAQRAQLSLLQTRHHRLAMQWAITALSNSAHEPTDVTAIARWLWQLADELRALERAHVEKSTDGPRSHRQAFSVAVEGTGPTLTVGFSTRSGGHVARVVLAMHGEILQVTCDWPIEGMAQSVQHMAANHMGASHVLAWLWTQMDALVGV